MIAAWNPSLISEPTAPDKLKKNRSINIDNSKTQGLMIVNPIHGSRKFFFSNLINDKYDDHEFVNASNLTEDPGTRSLQLQY